MTLKDLIEQLCGERNMSVRDVERKAEIKPRTIQHWDSSEPSAKKLYKVAIALGVPSEELLAVYDTELGTLSYVKKEKTPTLLNAEEAEVIKLYRKADPHDKNNVKQILSRYQEDTASAVG